MPIIRKKLAPSDVYPDDIRYNPSGDKVQRLIDGEWVDAPESDPRLHTTLPPRLTADPACDGAQSIADALEGQINAIATAIDNAQTVAQIAGLILGLFSFGVFAIFINIALAIAGYMLDAGTAAILAALPPSAYDTLKCILYCHMDENGRIYPGDLSAIQTEVGDQVGGLGAAILNDMMSLAGEGGLNNLASLGTSTGSCGSCGCSNTWCYIFDFTLSDWDWDVIVADGYNNGVWNGAGGWGTTDHVNTTVNPDVGERSLYIKKSLSPRNVTKVILTYNYTGGTFDAPSLRALFIALNGTDRGNLIRSVMVNGSNLTYTITGTWGGTERIDVYLRSSRDSTSPYAYSGAASLLKVQMEGEGTNPFGTDNCP